MKPGSLALVASTAAVAAAAAYFATRQEVATPDDGNATAVHRSATGRPIAAHLDYTPTERLRVAKNAVSRMASDIPERLGPLKEEIVLLCDDPNVAAFVAAEFAATAFEGAFVASAFGDVFAGAKRPEFVEPTRILLRSDDALLRRKGVEAATTQRDPSLLPDVASALRRGAEEGPEKTLPTRLEAVRAAARTGGPLAAAILQAGIRDPEPVVRRVALEAAAELDLRVLDPDLKTAYATAEDPTERVAAAAAAAKRDGTARATLFSFLNPRDPGLSAYAASAVLKTRPEGAAAVAKAYVAEARDHARIALRSILAAYGDAEEIARCEADLRSNDAGAAADAAAVLSRSGRKEVAPALLAAIEKHGAAVVGPIAGGFAEVGADHALSVAERLLEVPAKHPAELFQFAARVGESLVPKIAAELDRATTDERRRYLAATLMDVGGPKARAEAFRRRAEAPAVYDAALRILDLAARREGR
jgi:hypothetical protein